MDSPALWLSRPCLHFPKTPRSSGAIFQQRVLLCTKKVGDQVHTPRWQCSRGGADLSNAATAANLPQKLTEPWAGKYLFTICSLLDTITLYLAIWFACFLIATDSPAPWLSETCLWLSKTQLPNKSIFWSEICLCAEITSDPHIGWQTLRCRMNSTCPRRSDATPQGILPLKLTELWPGKYLLYNWHHYGG